MDAKRWSRGAATLMMCAVTGAVVVVTQQDGEPAAARDPHAAHLIPRMVPVAITAPGPLPRTGWTVTADSSPSGTGAGNAIDDNPATTWRTAATALPHTLTIDTGNLVAVGGLSYLPPSDSPNGRIGRYRISVSGDGTAYTDVANGTFADDEGVKTSTFATVLTRFVRLTALSEAGNRGSWSAAAEIHLLGGTDPALARTGWTVSADSQETAAENGAAANVLDGNTATMWHTAWSTAPAAPLPHQITVDTKATHLISGLSYLPRQGGGRNGTIGQYRVETSTDGATWGAAAATGRFADVSTAQTVTFDPRIARYVRLTALTEAGNRGPWSSAAELNLLGRADPTLARTGWTVTASDQETARENGAAANVLDGNAATIWHSAWSSTPPAPLPHLLTVDLRTAVRVGGLAYLPRPAASPNGRIGRYKIETSTDGTAWSARVTGGAFADNPALQTVVFPPATARYVRLTAESEAGTRGPWSSAAEINLLGPSGSVAPARGTWSAPVGFPLVPAAAAQLPDGKILTWSAYARDTFSGGRGRTVTATYDPATGEVTQRTVTETGHDMFCPGISVLPNGRIVVTGGNDSARTSIYDPGTDAWTTGPAMTTARGYQSSTTLSDGRIFTIGGSWSGGVGGTDGTPRKAGEVYSTATGWTALPGARVEPMLTADANPNGDYRKDNHAWLFGWSGGTVLQAGPSRAMNWYTTAGTGGTTPAGNRADDVDAMNGNAVMYDAGKILTVGGATSYENVDASTSAYALSISGTTVTARRTGSLTHARSFANSVVLPDGKVVVFGGQNYPVPFSDNTAVLGAEMWDPATESFTTLASAAIPRTYHSVALLMPDARVFTGGGGLCGNCGTNHFDGEIFTPPNLLNPDGTRAPRPVITTAPATAGNGASITVATDRAVSSFAIVRMGTATHSVNTDQRRIALAPTAVTGGYRLTIPADRGVALPGYWMLFAMDARGVPSVAKTIRIG
ncbi:discoidin domain-containing protein [Couchioplanes caeruleus]|uniref:Arabinogalactan endo-1,4-beta-galactosidase n=2 Tax=Couchioplanes caeruleus TaxID=56438 RepID=A0A1K0FMW1_9ACTN|nr:discoidin domain-containing protein [Couchioplanes caeruleus]OJF14165.1 arabinogalactan endo-1,4-beta-galactosidase [Couchioplanes caeruleus subsp. caeruleus]ROP28697.1 galactose oxidase [Couchioplanes caeruleus]